MDDQFTFKDLEMSVGECRSHLKQVQAILEKEAKSQKSNQKRIEDYKKLEKDLLEKRHKMEKMLDAIKKEKEEKCEFSNAIIKSSDNEKICEAYFEEEKRWYAAKILNVDEIGQICEILWIGFKEKMKIPAKYIKVQKVPERSELNSGTYCEAIYSEDGRFYPCVIEQVLPEGYSIKFVKYKTHETVPREYIRLTKDGRGIKRPYESFSSFKTPDHLKVKPTDTPEQKRQKKKKLKAIKQHIKSHELDKEARDRQNVWLNFNSSASKSKKGYYATKKADSIFKSPDNIDGKVGVTGSGKGMTKTPISQSEKNVHKSRIF